MPRYDELDSWKACHELVLAVYQGTTELLERDPSTANRLRYLALRAAGKLAFGSGTGSRVLMRQSADIALGYLVELGHDLAMAETLGVLPSDRGSRLKALCGRAHFYTMKHVLPPALPPEAGPPEAGGRHEH